MYQGTQYKSPLAEAPEHWARDLKPSPFWDKPREKGAKDWDSWDARGHLKTLKYWKDRFCRLYNRYSVVSKCHLLNVYYKHADVTILSAKSSWNTSVEQRKQTSSGVAHCWSQLLINVNTISSPPFLSVVFVSIRKLTCCYITSGRNVFQMVGILGLPMRRTLKRNDFWRKKTNDVQCLYFNTINQNSDVTQYRFLGLLFPMSSPRTLPLCVCVCVSSFPEVLCLTQFDSHENLPNYSTSVNCHNYH